MADKEPMNVVTSLEGNPRGNFEPWIKEIHGIALSAKLASHPSGLTSSVLSDEQWNADPRNIILPDPANGIVAGHVARPIFADPGIYVQVAGVPIRQKLEARYAPIRRHHARRQ